MPVQPASIVVLNWNGLELLRRNLPHLQLAVEASGAEHETILVDNGSADGSVAFVKQHHPWIRVISLPVNMGLVRGYNIGSMFASHNVVVHLNNSVRVNRDFLRFMLPHFSRADVFAVHPKLVADDGTIEAELSFATFRDRFLYPQQPHAFAPDAPYYLAPCYSMYAPGGCSAYSRWKFWALGGNDEIYSPFHWEESDLSYRAWKREWKVLFEPRSVGWHEVHATIGRVDARYSQKLYFRNWLLFNWINLTDAQLLKEHFESLPGWIDQGVLYREAFEDALRFIPNVISRRKTERGSIRLSDGEVLAMLANNGTGVPNGTFVACNGACFLIEKGRRRPLANESVMWAHGAVGNVLEVGRDVLERFPEDDPLAWPDGTAVREDNGTVSLVHRGRRRVLDSMETSQLLGITPASLPARPASDLTGIPLGPPIDLGLGGSANGSRAQLQGIYRLLAESDW